MNILRDIVFFCRVIGFGLFVLMPVMVVLGSFATPLGETSADRIIPIEVVHDTP